MDSYYPILYDQQVREDDKNDMTGSCNIIDIDNNSFSQIETKNNFENTVQTVKSNFEESEKDRGDISDLFLYIPSIHHT